MNGKLHVKSKPYSALYVILKMKTQQPNTLKIKHIKMYIHVYIYILFVHIHVHHFMSKCTVRVSKLFLQKCAQAYDHIVDILAHLNLYV